MPDPVLTPTDVEELRQEVRDILPDVATIHRLTSDDSEWGGETDTYSVVLTAPVLVMQQSGTETRKAGAIVTDVGVTFLFPGGTILRQSDQITVDSMPGRKWEVTSIGGGGSWEIALSVGVKELV